MTGEWIYSPKEGIPLFRIINFDEGNPGIEFKNIRTKKTEVFSENSLLYLIATAIDRYKKEHLEGK